jgi:uncharacterized protein
MEENVKEKRARHNKINYIEFAAIDLEKTKEFFTRVFGWEFTDYGPDYTAFEGRSAVDCGFYRADNSTTYESSGAVVVFYSENLEETESKIKRAGGAIVREITPFPGGRRFHFMEPSGNEIAVWSDIE